MAASSPLFRSFPAPTHEEAEALRPAEAYLKRAGTQVASRLLGYADPDRDTAVDAEIGNALLRSATLCADLRALADAADRPLASEAWPWMPGIRRPSTSLAGGRCWPRCSFYASFLPGLEAGGQEVGEIGTAPRQPQTKSKRYGGGRTERASPVAGNEDAWHAPVPGAPARSPRPSGRFTRGPRADRRVGCVVRRCPRGHDDARREGDARTDIGFVTPALTGPGT